MMHTVVSLIALRPGVGIVEYGDSVANLKPAFRNINYELLTADTPAILKCQVFNGFSV